MFTKLHPNRVARSLGDVEEFFNQFFNGGPPADPGFHPPCDVCETESAYQISLELPGVAMDDISIEMIEGHLQISGEKKIASCDESGKSCHRGERRGGRFQRTFQLPNKIDGDKVEASLEHGLLIVTLPKVPEVLPRKIEIRG